MPTIGPTASAQADERLRIVDHLAAMVFQGDLLDAVLAGQLYGLLPVRDQYLIPLPFQDLGRDRRPAGDDSSWGYDPPPSRPGSPTS